MVDPQEHSEAARLAELRKYLVLDTPPERRFDHITRLAARQLGFPAALVSLVDEHRQWNKSRWQVDVDEAPRSQSFCAHAIQSDQVLYIPDASADPLFAHNELVAGPFHLRAYAGAPLIAPGGHRLGTLCVIDREPRHDITPAALDLLRDLAAIVVEMLEYRLAEQRGHEAELRYQTLVASLDDVVSVHDEHRRIQWISDAVTGLTGHQPAELIGQETMSLVHPEDHPVVGQAFTAARRQQRVRLEWRCRRQDGGWVWTESRARLLNSAGHPPQLVVVSRDISERKRTEQQLRLYETAVVHAHDAILVADAGPAQQPGPRILYVNKAFTEQTGYLPEEVYGQTPRILQGPQSDPAARRRIRDALAQWRPVREELLNYRKDGTPFWVELNIVPVSDGQDCHRYWISIQRDITERKKAEQSLADLNAQLERRVTERTQELTGLNRELEAFTYAVSHDLRAPLRAIRGLAEILLEDYPGEMLDETGQDYLRRMARASDRMGQLITGLLQLSRLGRGELVRETVDLSALADSIAADLQTVWPHRYVRFHCADGLQVTGDPRLLRVAMENLLSNAWKYTGQRAEADVEFGAVTVDGRWQYFVRDNGAGFNPEHLPQLFQPFRRLHAEAEFEGTGLGLATVQRIIQRHGGRIWAEAAVNAGATFWFTLP